MMRRLRLLCWPRSRNAADNPYTSLLYDALEQSGVDTVEFSIRRALRSDFDILHVHWPEGVLKQGGPVRQLVSAAAVSAVLLTTRYIRRKGVVWTVHNLAPHTKASGLALAVLRAGLRASTSGLIFLSNASRSELTSLLPWTASKPFVVTPHGRYGASYSSVRDAEAVRAELGIRPGRKLVAFIGRMSRYKAPHALVSAFEQAPELEADLLLAGEFPPDDYGTSLRRSAAAVNAIVEEGKLSNSRMAELVSAADLLVYPYERILNSGSVVLPLEFRKQVLAPAQGSIPELAQMVGGGWVRTYDGELSADQLRRAISSVPITPHPDLTRMEWSLIAQQTQNFLWSIAEGGLRGGI